VKTKQLGKYLENIINSMPSILVGVDGESRVNQWNLAAEKMTGISGADAQGQMLDQVMPMLNLDFEKVRKAIGNRKVMFQAKVSRPEAGTVHYDDITIYPLVTDGVEGAVIRVDDVTERVRMEEMMIRSEKMASVGHLAAGMAHEIGNPLNSLYLNLQLLNHMFRPDEEPDLDESREMLKVCRNEVERLDNIINQFLHAIRPGESEMHDIDIRDVILDTLTFMQTEIETRKISVKCNWPDILPKIYGDVAQLKQAFFNVLRNAIQAMPQGGEIGVNGFYNDDYIVLEFTDTGDGISADKLNRMFDPFKSFKKGGTGLGMMIIERVLRLHGAEISVDTREGEGTAIVIKFPRPGRRIRVLNAAEPSEWD